MILQPLIPPLILLAITICLAVFFVYQLRKKENYLPWIRRATFCAVLILTSLGISISQTSNAKSKVLDLNVIFMVDTTTSMGAIDYANEKTRISGARKDMREIIAQMPGAYFTIITFDSNALVAAPLTADAQAAITSASTIPREYSSRSRGSSIDQGLELTIAQLKKSKEAHRERKRILFYLGDGEQTVKKEPASFKELKDLVDSGAVMGYGTAKGGQMIANGPTSGLGDACDKEMSSCYVEDYNEIDTPAISKANPGNLKTIAKDLDVDYYDRNNGGAVDQVINSKNIKSITQDSQSATSYQNLYFIFANVLAALVLWEVLYLITKHKELKLISRGLDD